MCRANGVVQEGSRYVIDIGAGRCNKMFPRGEIKSCPPKLRHIVSSIQISTDIGYGFATSQHQETARYEVIIDCLISLLTVKSDLQTQYTNYKNTLQSLAQKIGEIEQDID